MIRILLSACLVLFFNTATIAQNGTLAITVDAPPAGGTPNPKILVMHGFDSVYQNAVSWGGNWNLNVPSGNYIIHSLPVSDGTNFYTANTIFVFVPPGGTANKLVTHHSI